MAPLDPALAKRIGPLAYGELCGASPAFEPAARFGEAALRERLIALAYEPHDAAMAFESVWGGLSFADVEPYAGRWVVGAGACAGYREYGGDVGRREGLVCVASAPNDVYYFLARDGRAWGQDSFEEPAASPFAVDADRMMARIVLFRLASARRLRDLELVVPREIATVAAATLALPLIAEATDANGRSWGDGRAVVLEDCGTAWRDACAAVAVDAPALLARVRALGP